MGEQKRKAKQHLEKVCADLKAVPLVPPPKKGTPKGAPDSLRAVPLVDVDKKGSGGGAPNPEQKAATVPPPRISPAQAQQLMNEVMAGPIQLLEKFPDPYAHGLDLDLVGRLMKEEFLPLTETVSHFLSYIRELQAEPIIKDLENELLRREASLERFEAAVARWIAQMPRKPLFLGGKPYLQTRAMEQEAIDLLEENIRYLEGFGKFLHGVGVFTAVIELGKNLYELFEALRDPKAQETHEVAFYVMGTAIAGVCVFCILAVGLELAVIGATMGIVGGIMNAFLEPLAKEEYVSGMQKAAKGHQISKGEYESAVRILRMQ